MLRGRETLAMLAALAEGGWISAEAARDLEAAYLFLRTVEHRLQMVADEQTHTLPADRDELDRFARFLGFAGRDAFAVCLLDHLRKVQRHYARLFEDAPALTAKRRPLVFSPEADRRETLDQLVEMGFRRPTEISASVRRWLSGEYRSLRSEIGAHAARRADAGAARRARRAPKTRTGQSLRSIVFSPASRAARASFRCCGRIPISSRCSRSFSAPRRGSPTSWRATRRSWMR